MPDPAQPSLIHARGLTKKFGEFTAVDAIDFDVAPGESFGFLGPNGAGKTSTMRMIGCVSPPTAGTLRILGLDPVADGARIRGRLGVVPQQDTLDNELTVRENLIIYGRYFGLSRREVRVRADRLLEFVQLAERASDKVEPLSGGMRRRLTIARSLVNEPEVLLLDEPTDGVDPVGRREIRDLLQEEARRGRAILLNSHLLSEIEQTCGRVAILRKGRVVREGRIEDLTRQEARYRMVARPVDERLLEAFRATGAAVERVNGHLILSVRDLAHVNDLVDRLRAQGVSLEELSPDRSTLEDVFVDLVRAGAPAGEKVN
jgi:lipooligosaccharide transport system ATP-binding protein